MASCNLHKNTQKCHEIVFNPTPEQQVERAYLLLAGLEGCKVKRCDHNPLRLIVSYDLHDYTLEGLEQALEQEGFQLDHSLLHSIGRKVIYYCEDTMCHNMDIPVHPTKKNERPVFAKAYQQVPHGDHDDTPPELREYK